MHNMMPRLTMWRTVIIFVSLFFSAKSDQTSGNDTYGEDEMLNSLEMASFAVKQPLKSHSHDGCHPEHHFQCSDSASSCNCHSIHALCDGIEDCVNGEDENSTLCIEKCESLHGWWCSKHNRCIHRTQLCDGSYTCGRKSEKLEHCREVDCPIALGYIRCPDHKQCVRIKDLCNTQEQSPCLDGWVPHTSLGLCNMDKPISPNCSESIPLNSTYSGKARPQRTVGAYDGGVSVCEAALFAHNFLRRNHLNTDPLIYGDDLAAAAEAYAIQMANEKIFSHSSSDARNGLGENLFFASITIDAKYTLADALFRWYTEIADYDFKNSTGTNTTGHFTQVVWKDTVRVGCGIATIQRERYYFTYIACHYDPPGNYIGEYEDNVMPLNRRAKIPEHPMVLEYENGGCIDKSMVCRKYAMFCGNRDFSRVCPLTCMKACSEG